jgi:hypothetical protein
MDKSQLNIKPNSLGKLMLILSFGGSFLMFNILVTTKAKILVMLCPIIGFLIPIFGMIGFTSGLYNIAINKRLTLPNFFIIFVNVIVVLISLVGLYVVYGMTQYN